MTDTTRYDFDTIKEVIELLKMSDSLHDPKKLKEELDECKSRMDNDKRIYSDILNGNYDDYGFKIYRIFRDEYGMIMKCSYVCDGLFKEVDLNLLLTGNAFRPKERWKKK